MRSMQYFSLLLGGYDLYQEIIKKVQKGQVRSGISTNNRGYA